MSDVDQPASTLLQSLKGAPLSIMVALAVHGPQSQRGLMSLTGWKKQALRGALVRLVDEGLVVRCNYRTWALPEGVTLQALLGAREAEAGEGVSEALAKGEVRLDRHAEGWGKRLPAQEWEADSPPEGPEDHLSGGEWEADSHSEVRVDRLSGLEWEADSHSQVRVERLSAQGWEADSPSEVRVERLSAREWEADSLSDDEAPPNGVSVLTRDDHDHDVDPYMSENEHHSNKHDARGAPNGHLAPSLRDGQAARMERLVQRLQMLDPPFSGAGAWLKSAPLRLVEAWVQHMDAMAPDQRRRIRNEAAFLRAKVAAGRAPPRARPTGREPCPRCGKAYFNREGVCLVCAGVVVT